LTLCLSYFTKRGAGRPEAERVKPTGAKLIEVAGATKIDIIRGNLTWSSAARVPHYPPGESAVGGSGDPGRQLQQS